jgi:hypothetical protein
MSDDIPQHPQVWSKPTSAKSNSQFTRSCRPDWYVKRQDQNANPTSVSATDQIECDLMILAGTANKLKPEDVRSYRSDFLYGCPPDQAKCIGYARFLCGFG